MATKTKAADRKQLLAGLEARIAAGQAAYVDVAEALQEVDRQSLYQDAGFDNFESYCRERWKMSDRLVRYWIRAAVVCGNIGQRVPEYYARLLADLSPEDQRLVWEMVEAGGEVTGSAIREVREELEALTAEEQAAAAQEEEEQVEEAEKKQPAPRDRGAKEHIKSIERLLGLAKKHFQHLPDVVEDAEGKIQVLIELANSSMEL